MDHLKIDRFHLLGTAAGGFVAVDYALAFPRRLRSLIVANSIGGRRTTSRLYFFSAAGGTWEIECQSTADKAKVVADACDGVVRSVDVR